MYTGKVVLKNYEAVEVFCNDAISYLMKAEVDDCACGGGSIKGK